MALCWERKHHDVRSGLWRHHDSGHFGRDYKKSLCSVIFFSFSTLYGLNNDALVEDSKNCNRHLLHTLNDNLTNVT